MAQDRIERMGYGCKIQLIADLIKWVLKTFGEDIVIFVTDQLKSVWRSYFTGRNILILGDKQAGKSSLIMFMRSGKPYEELNGQKRAPNPTAGAVIADSSFKAKTGRLDVLKDVGGDAAFRSLWKELIVEVEPQGIIYMMDGNRVDGRLQEGVAELRRDVLIPITEVGKRPRVLHVFLNFSDQWMTTEQAARAKCRVLSEAFDAAIADLPGLENLKFDISRHRLLPRRHLGRAPRRLSISLAPQCKGSDE